MEQNVVLVTGCSSGIGLAIAAKLASDERKQFKVTATMRNLSKRGALEEAAGEASSDSLQIQQLDVCNEASIQECISSIPNKHIDILSIMFNDVYAASKFVVEGLCESLVVQTLKFNINITLIEPGPVVTEFEEKVFEEAMKADYSSTDPDTADMFVKVYLENTKNIVSSTGHRPEDVAEETMKVINSEKPPFRHQTNPLYTPMIALKHADPSGQLATDVFYKMLSSTTS